MACVENILVRGPNWLGDLVLALPFAQALQSSYPQSKITWIVPQPFGDWAGNHFAPAEVLCFSKGPQNSKRDFWALARSLKAKSFDLGISLNASVSSAVLLYLAKIPHRVGFAEPAARLFHTASLPWNKNLPGYHKSEMYLHLLQWMNGHSLPNRSQLMTPKKTERESLGILAPGASITLREWPYFDKLLIRLTEEFPHVRWKVVGSEKETRWSQKLATLFSVQVEDCIGQTTLTDLEELCRRASIVVANDSGVAHLAGTVSQAPTVVLFGPGDPAYIRPRGPAVTVCRLADLPCSPCESAECRGAYGYQTCLRSLSVEKVLAEIRMHLTETQS